MRRRRRIWSTRRRHGPQAWWLVAVLLVVAAAAFLAGLAVGSAEAGGLRAPAVARACRELVQASVTIGLAPAPFTHRDRSARVHAATVCGPPVRRRTEGVACTARLRPAAERVWSALSARVATDHGAGYYDLSDPAVTLSSAVIHQHRQPIRTDNLAPAAEVGWRPSPQSPRPAGRRADGGGTAGWPTRDQPDLVWHADQRRRRAARARADSGAPTGVRVGFGVHRPRTAQPVVAVVYS